MVRRKFIISDDTLSVWHVVKAMMNTVSSIGDSSAVALCENLTYAIF